MRAAPRARPEAGLAGLVGLAALLGTLGGTLLWLQLLAGPWRLATGLLEFRLHVARAEEGLSAGALKAARFETYGAAAAARRARAGLEAPGWIDVARLAPAVDAAMGEVPRLVGAAGSSAAAASDVLAVVERSQKGPDKVIAEDPERPGHRKIHVDRVEAIGELVSSARVHVRAARAELRAIDPSALPARARGPVRRGIRRASKSDALLADAEAGFAILPGFLGGNEPRTYLLAMQNSAEQRGTGGAILQYAFLRVDDGRQKLLDPRTVYDVDVDRRTITIPLPDDAWYVAGIEDAQRFGNSNWSPDWPLSSKLMLRYARATEAAYPDQDFPDDVDGVIGVDPIAVQQLMPGVGRYRIKAGNIVTAQDVVHLVLYKAYASYPIPQVRRFVLHQVVDGFYEGLLEPSSPSALVEGMGAALSNKHVQIWLADDAEQSFIERMDWDAAIAPSDGEDYIYVVEQNVGGNKLDLFDENTSSMGIRIEGADALVSIRALVRNDIFLPQPRWALGNVGPFHQPMLNVYVPREARLRAWEVEKGELLSAPAPAVPNGDLPAEHLERGRKVWTTTIRIPPQQEGAVRFDYTSPDVVRRVGERSVYRLLVQHQPKVRAETLQISLELPEDAVDVVAPGWNVRGSTLTWRRPLEKDQLLEVSWRSRGQ